jgi:PAS domain-containing protein
LNIEKHPHVECWAFRVQAGKIWQGRLINRRKNGSRYTEEMRIVPIFRENCAITGYIAIKRDVSEQCAAEESRRLLASIVESSEDGIIAYSPEGTIWNQGAEVTFGYCRRGGQRTQHGVQLSCPAILRLQPVGKVG